MFPYKCDAVLYHLPIATVSLIVLNVAAYVSSLTGHIDPSNGWLLEYGSGIHPQQWLLSCFMHQDLMLLLGNMLFLWIFGLIVEGKIGWWRFLSCYLAIGVGQAALEQVVLLGTTGWSADSMGASAIIFGLMGMACVWAPMNEISIMFFFLFYRVYTFEITVGVLAAFYVGMELLMGLLLGQMAIGVVPNLIGVAIGVAIAVVLLKRGKVDCDHWDIFSVWRGEEGPNAKKETFVPSDEQVTSRQDDVLLEAQRRMFALLKTNQPAEALALKRRMIDLGTPLELDREQMLSLIVGLHKLEQWKDSAPIMAEFLEAFPEQSEKVRLKLAQICLVELEQPSKALSLLQPLTETRLEEAEEKLRNKLVRHAQRQIDAGVLEMEDELW